MCFCNCHSARIVVVSSRESGLKTAVSVCIKAMFSNGVSSGNSSGYLIWGRIMWLRKVSFLLTFLVNLKTMMHLFENMKNTTRKFILQICSLWYELHTREKERVGLKREIPQKFQIILLSIILIFYYEVILKMF